MIRRLYTIQYGNTIFEGGHFYHFSYRKYENDPEPLFLFYYALRGIHPSTGHYWNFLQGVNLSYVPLKIRRSLVREYVTQNMNWRTYQPKTRIRISPKYFPSYLDIAIRRYLLNPPNLIVNPREISYEIIDAYLANIARRDYFTRANIQRAKLLMNKPIFRIKRRK